MKRISEAIQEFRDGHLSDADLYRTLMAWPSWHVRAEESDEGTRLGVLTDHRGFRVLELFSDGEALEAFHARETDAERGKMLQMAGFQLFSTLADESVQRINLDLHSPHATHFFEQQIPLLRAWAEVVTVELALAVPDRMANPFAILRRFDGYNVLVRELGEHRDFVMAPDPDLDRTLAAVFTADDTIEEFIEVVEAQLEGTLHVERMTGAELFEALGQMPLDGVVFNPLTHLPPIALSAQAIPRIVESA